MNLDEINIELSRNNIDFLNKKMDMIYESLIKKFYYDLDNFKWCGSAKNKFTESIQKLCEEIKNIDLILDKSIQTINQVYKIKQLEIQKEELEKENEILKQNVQLLDKNKIIENERQIADIQSKIENTKLTIYNEWR